MSQNTVYELKPFYDIPKYEGFAAKFNSSFLGHQWLEEDFRFPTAPSCRDWQAPRLAAVWKPVEVIGRVRSFNDYPCIGLIPAFSQRAIEALREFLEPNGEILPLISSVGPYYAYNITTVAHVVDLDHSDILWPKGTEKDRLVHIRRADRVDTYYAPIIIKRYELIPERLEGLTIFRIPEETSGAYVTEPFVARARECKLEGMNFIKVWPLPRGASWKMLNEEKVRRMQRKANRGRLVKGNCVALRLRAAGDARKPTSAEIADVERLMDELDAALINVDVDASEAGSLEGHEWIGGDCRLFFSCPDADALVEKLWPWLKSLHWPGQVMLMKRYGEMRDANAREEYVDLSGSTPRYQSPVISERLLSDEERDEVASFCDEAYRILRIDSGADPDQIQSAIQAWLVDFGRKKRRLSKEKLADTALALGSAWGQAVCDKLGWQWAAAKLISRDTAGYAILPPERQYVIYPTENFFAVLGGSRLHVNTPNTLELYEKLKAGTVGNRKPKSYEIID
jgi:hypothetical protein